MNMQAGPPPDQRSVLLWAGHGSGVVGDGAGHYLRFSITEGTDGPAGGRSASCAEEAAAATGDDVLTVGRDHASPFHAHILTPGAGAETQEWTFELAGPVDDIGDPSNPVMLCWPPNPGVVSLGRRGWLKYKIERGRDAPTDGKLFGTHEEAAGASGDDVVQVGQSVADFEHEVQVANGRPVKLHFAIQEQLSIQTTAIHRVASDADLVVLDLGQVGRLVESTDGPVNRHLYVGVSPRKVDEVNGRKARVVGSRASVSFLRDEVVVIPNKVGRYSLSVQSCDSTELIEFTVDVRRSAEAAMAPLPTAPAKGESAADKPAPAPTDKGDPKKEPDAAKAPGTGTIDSGSGEPANQQAQEQQSSQHDTPVTEQPADAEPNPDNGPPHDDQASDVTTPGPVLVTAQSIEELLAEIRFEPVQAISYFAPPKIHVVPADLFGKDDL